MSTSPILVPPAPRRSAMAAGSERGAATPHGAIAPTLRGRGAGAAVLALYVAAVVYGVHAVVGSRTGVEGAVFTHGVYDGVLVGAALLAAVRACGPGATRYAWCFLAGSLATAALSGIGYSLRVGAGAPLPQTLETALHLLSYPLAYGWMVALALAGRTQRLPVTTWLDAAVAALGLGAVGLVLFNRVVDGGAGGVESVIAPLADMLLIGLAAILASTGGRDRRVAALAVAGLLLLVAGDLQFLVGTAVGGWRAGGALDGLWLLAATSMGATAWLGEAGPAAAGGWPAPRPLAAMAGGGSAVAVLVLGVVWSEQVHPVLLAGFALAVLVARVLTTARAQAFAAPAPAAYAPPRSPLTDREQAVLRLIAEGRSNRAVGRELHISERTVARHVSNIFRKLDVTSRAHAVKVATDRNVL